MQILIFIVVLFFALTCITCGRSSDGVAPTLTPSPIAVSTFATYTNESHGFSLLYPSDWVSEEISYQQQSYGLILVLSAPEICGETPTQFKVRKDELVNPTNVQDYFELKKPLLTGLKDYTPLSDEKLTVNDMDAIKHVCTYHQYEQTVYVMVLAIVCDSTGWYMYCTCNESCSSECEAVFDTMADSFQLLER